jgi:hypothetical protein
MNNSNQIFLSFLKYSCDFLIAAEMILNNSNETPLPLPTYFLYARSIELSLKAFLINSGYKIEDLKKKYGHNLEKLFGEADSKNLCEIIEIDEYEKAALKVLNLSYMDKQYEYYPHRNNEAGYYHEPYIRVVEQLARKLVHGLKEYFEEG